MTNRKYVVGKATHVNIGTGTWGIIDQDGHKWEPVNMPEQLKTEGAKVECTLHILEDAVSIYMWGKPAKILSFHTLTP